MKYIKKFENFDTDLNIVAEIEYDDELLKIVLQQNNPFDILLYAIDENGEDYIDITTKLENNDLTDAVWIQENGKEEDIANILIDKNILEKTTAVTKQGFNHYRKYDLKINN